MVSGNGPAVQVRAGNSTWGFGLWQREDGRVFTALAALTLATTPTVGHEVPACILVAVTDGTRGHFLQPEDVPDFMRLHADNEWLVHGCAADLAVLAALVRSRGHHDDVYELVDQHRLWDVELLDRLYCLAMEGHSLAPDERSLESCTQAYLGWSLPAGTLDEAGNDVSTSWHLWQGCPFGGIPELYLQHLAVRALSIRWCWDALRRNTDALLKMNLAGVWGFGGTDWLRGVIARHGPLGHHLQVKAAVALDAVQRAGIGVDLAQRDDLLPRLRQRVEELQVGLRCQGHPEAEPDEDQAVQTLIGQALKAHPYLQIPRTADGRYATQEEDLDALAEVSEVFARLKEYRQARTLLAHFPANGDYARVHRCYDPLITPTRTALTKPTVPGLRRPRKRINPFDFRRCFAPAAGNVFYVLGCPDIEFRTLAQALHTQFPEESALAAALNAGRDPVQLLAARLKASQLPNASDVVADPTRFAEVVASVTAAEREIARAAGRGLSAGMVAPDHLEGYPRVQLGLRYNSDDARAWRKAWEDAFPEMDRYLKSEVAVPFALAREAGLTTGGYEAATGGRVMGTSGEEAPDFTLGCMALRVLRHSRVAKQSGEPYSAAMLDYFWGRLQQLGPSLPELIAWGLRERGASPNLCDAVKRLVDRGGVFTLTGRLRGNASFTARRSTLFRGAAADAANLARYRLWRAGHTVVAFDADEIVLEVDAHADRATIKTEIDGIFTQALREICPDVAIKVEGTFRTHWGDDPADAPAPRHPLQLGE
jgi:hypothetical protein